MNLIKGDCLEKMKGIKSGSVDAVITSPPYNMNLRIRNGKYCSRQIVKEISTKYENFSDNLSMGEYFEFNKNVIDECLRVSDLVFYNVQFLTGNKPALFKLLGHFHEKVKEFIVWDKVNAQPAIGKNVLNSQFEVIIVFQNSSPEAGISNQHSLIVAHSVIIGVSREEGSQQKRMGLCSPLSLQIRLYPISPVKERYFSIRLWVLELLALQQRN